jgi:hypothetical protein
MLTLLNLRKGEKVEMVIRRHWIVFAILWFYFILAILFTLLILVLLWNNSVGYLVTIMFWLVYLIWFYIQWLNHELDLFIITNNRIIWVEQISFLNRTVSEANLWQVQEVNSKTKWFWANILDYGDVMVQTAWTVSNFDINFAPQPIQTSRKILNVVDKYRDTDGTMIEPWDEGHPENT